MTKRSFRALLAVPALVALLIALPAGAAPGKDPDERELAATMVIDYVMGEVQCGNCGPGGSPMTYPTCDYAIFVQFPKVKGAEDYHVVLRDNDPRVNTTYDLHGPPFQDVVGEYTAPAGTHRFGGFTSGSGAAPCAVTDPYMGGRFVIEKAVATMGQSRVVQGKVRARAKNGPGRLRVNLIAYQRFKWRVVAHTTSDVQGNYEVEAPPGTKDIKRWRVGVGRRGYCLAGVRACKVVAEFSFRRSGDEDRRTFDFETEARHRDVWGGPGPIPRPRG
jgi:hypothetical protein